MNAAAALLDPIPRLPLVGRAPLLQGMVAKVKTYFSQWSSANWSSDLNDTARRWGHKSANYLTVFNGSGQGKTRVCVELCGMLQREAERGELGGTQRCLVLPLSLGSAVFDGYGSLGNATAAALLLAAFLDCSVQEAAFGGAITLALVLEALRSYLGGARPVVIMLIDEANNAEPLLLGQLFRTLLSPNFLVTAHPCMVYPIAFGTHTPDKTLSINITGVSFENVYLPLLSEAEVAELLERLADETAVADRTQPQRQPPLEFALRGSYSNVRAFMQLLSDAYGWPRGIEVVQRLVSAELNSGELITSLDFRVIADRAQERIRALYLTGKPPLPLGAIRLALLGVQVKLTDKIAGSDVTIEELVYRRSQAVLEPSGRLVIPFLWLSAHVSHFKQHDAVLKKLHELLYPPAEPALGWDKFEVFCARVMGLRVTVLGELQRSRAELDTTAGALLAGVRWAWRAPAVAIDLSDSERHGLGLSGNSCAAPACSTMAHKWPSTAGSTDAAATQLPRWVRLRDLDLRLDLCGGGCGVALVNAPSAPYADVVLSLKVIMGANKPFLVLLQCKWHNATADLASVAAEEYGKCGAMWREHRLEEHFAGWALVIVTSANVATLPAKCSDYGDSYLGCVSRSEFTDFFGPTLAGRLGVKD